MANIAKRASGKYRARYRDQSGREHAKHFAKKADAERWLRAEQTKLDHGEWSDPIRGKVTVGAWSAQWLEGQVQLKPSTHQRYRSLLRVHVDPTWSTTPLSAVSHAAVQTWVTKLTTSGLSGSSVRQAYGVLTLVLSLAVRDRRISSNPADGVTLPRKAKPDKRFLTPDEVARLAEGAGTHRFAVMMLAYTGLRYGELAALRVRRVDLVRRRLEIAESVTEVNGVAEFGTPEKPPAPLRAAPPLPRGRPGRAARRQES